MTAKLSISAFHFKFSSVQFNNYGSIQLAHLIVIIVGGMEGSKKLGA